MSLLVCVQRAHYRAHNQLGNCSVVSSITMKMQTHLFDWDLSRCRKYVHDPLDAVFLNPCKVHMRNGTSDVGTVASVRLLLHTMHAAARCPDPPRAEASMHATCPHVHGGLRGLSAGVRLRCI
jgi:hypothetical protein